MSANESAVEPIAASPAELQAVAASPPATRPRPRWVAKTGYAGLVWLASYAFVATEGRSMAGAVGVSVLLTCIWLVALQMALTATRLHTSVGGAVILGSAAGVAASSALGLWVPALDLRPLPLLGTGAAIVLLTSAWRAFLS